MRRLAMGLCLALARCGGAGDSGNLTGAAAADPDQLRPGQWEIVSTLGTVSQTGPDAQRVSECIRPQRIAQDPRETILRIVDRERCKIEGAQASRGSLSGHLICPGQDDIREHRQDISGSYSPERFRIVLDMGVFGTTIRQTVEAERKGDC